MDHKHLVEYIVQWLRDRNGAELEPAFRKMRLSDFEGLKSELEMILKAGGKPANWVR